MNFKPNLLKVIVSILIPIVLLMVLFGIRFSLKGLLYFFATGGLYLIVGVVIIYSFWSLFEKR